MHIFRIEIRHHLKELLFWSIGMVVLIEVGIMKYTSLALSGDAVREFMNQFPPMIQSIFGMTGLDVGTVAGYYGILFLYLAIMVAIHAGLLGESLFTREEREKTTEFLYVRPVSRHRVATEKMLAGLCNIIVLNLVTMAISFVSVAEYVALGDIAKEIYVFMLALFIIQLVFFFLGAALSVMFRSPKIAAPAISTVVFLSYITYVIYKLVPSVAALRALSVFSYFDAVTLIPDMDLEIGYVVVCAACILVCILVTYVFHSKRDFEL